MTEEIVGEIFCQIIKKFYQTIKTLLTIHVPAFLFISLFSIDMIKS